MLVGVEVVLKVRVSVEECVDLVVPLAPVLQPLLGTPSEPCRGFIVVWRWEKNRGQFALALFPCAGSADALYEIGVAEPCGESRKARAHCLRCDGLGPLRSRPRQNLRSVLLRSEAVRCEDVRGHAWVKPEGRREVVLGCRVGPARGWGLCLAL